jgi:hypothetical protein
MGVTKITNKKGKLRFRAGYVDGLLRALELVKEVDS